MECYANILTDSRAGESITMTLRIMATDDDDDDDDDDNGFWSLTLRLVDSHHSLRSSLFNRLRSLFQGHAGETTGILTPLS